jgi:hypothetical protein
LEQKYDAQFKVVFDAIRQLMSPPPPSRPKPIGFSDGEVTEKIPDLRCQCRGGYSGAMSLLIAGDDLGQATVGTGRWFGT